MDDPPPPKYQCAECGNPLGQPYHHPKSKRCYFSAGPWWQRWKRRND